MKLSKLDLAMYRGLFVDSAGLACVQCDRRSNDKRDSAN